MGRCSQVQLKWNLKAYGLILSIKPPIVREWKRLSAARRNISTGTIVIVTRPLSNANSLCERAQLSSICARSRPSSSTTRLTLIHLFVMTTVWQVAIVVTEQAMSAMQAPQSSQRSNQRRSPAVDPNLSAAPSGPVPNIPSSTQGAAGPAPRSSSGSAKSSSLQRRNVSNTFLNTGAGFRRELMPPGSHLSNCLRSRRVSLIF